MGIYYGIPVLQVVFAKALAQQMVTYNGFVFPKQMFDSSIHNPVSSISGGRTVLLQLPVCHCTWICSVCSVVPCLLKKKGGGGGGWALQGNYCLCVCVCVCVCFLWYRAVNSILSNSGYVVFGTVFVIIIAIRYEFGSICCSYEALSVVLCLPFKKP